MLAVTLFLALVLLVAAAHKAFARERMTAAAARLTGQSAPMGALAVLAAAAVELVAALALLMPGTRMMGGWIAALLWLGYAALLVRHRGKTLDCGCSFAAREKPVGLFEIGRAVFLALLGVTVALFPSAALTLEAPFAALALFALLTAGNELADNQPGLKRLSA